MDNFVTINKTKENIITFDISVQGLKTDDIRVWFSIKAGPIEVNIPCVKQSGDQWEVTIPPLQFIEMTAYPCCVQMVADGYYFEPMTGTVDVVGSHQVYTSNVSNTSFAPKAADTVAVRPVSSDAMKAAGGHDDHEHKHVGGSGMQFSFGGKSSVRETKDPRSTKIDNILSETRRPAQSASKSAVSRVTSKPIAQMAAEIVEQQKRESGKPSLITESLDAVKKHDPKTDKVDEILGSMGIKVAAPVQKSKFTTKK